MKWHDMDTSPKTGEYLLLCDSRGDMCTGRFVPPVASTGFNPLTVMLSGDTGYWQVYGSVAPFRPVKWTRCPRSPFAEVQKRKPARSKPRG